MIYPKPCPIYFRGTMSGKWCDAVIYFTFPASMRLFNSVVVVPVREHPVYSVPARITAFMENAEVTSQQMAQTE